MNATASIAVTPVFVADLLAENERMPVYVRVIDHPDARVLVDTGMTELHPAVADLDPRLREWVEAPGVRYVPVDGEPELVWLAHEHEPWRPPA
jgi:glyoxylase-like metal-dependent hydrolase (beta-lactamase superfamily II)